MRRVDSGYRAKPENLQLHGKNLSDETVEEYEAVRNSLIAMLEELDDRLTKITDDVRHVEEPLSQDFAEQAVQTENDEVLDHLGIAARTEIEHVRQAIARIDKGGYGLCESCGESIDKGRLKALPFARLCIKCAQAEEN
ncbi:MAG: conjugal transfer protein TraR [Gammaproteobacteria bacterium HGW-Gammaproteobacteria-3]|nr:MAG: conjugal transfer protein TraR [Gammaproteobacteria bacterium HGW-Gammaproteobacteria-3]